MKCEYEKAVTATTHLEGGSKKKIFDDGLYRLALAHVIDKAVVVGQKDMDGDIIYFLNPEKSKTEVKLPTKIPKYLRIDRPTDVQESQEYARHAQKLRGWK